MTSRSAMEETPPWDQIPPWLDEELEKHVCTADLPLSDETWARFRAYWEGFCSQREKGWVDGLAAAKAAHPDCLVNPGPLPWRPTPYTLWFKEEVADWDQREADAAMKSDTDRLKREIAHLENLIAQSLHAASPGSIPAPVSTEAPLPRFTPFAALLLGFALGSLLMWLQMKRW